ncbi:MAG: helix-turn-helix domain-containing protein [Candidatus Amulumruptor caecigallinarius]|nr:helix-turn-helix domain-containing protein [Candidatus Amulumruptor caecigallinarius]MCM1397729.1 helix-turn-helix domain-containing protein [Candidatus Amulumruptor caecigallinarius]MCM1454621.1 helix-turn-helix domain-containing protein [bacterium]
MAKILKVNLPGDYCSYVGAESRHPLVAVIDYDAISPVPSSLNDYGVYGVFIHSEVRDDIKYGLGEFGHTTGTLICVAPGQLGGREDDGTLIDLDGYALLFHPDLLIGTRLERDIRQFSFFDYSANEALYMEESEREIIASLMRSISDELHRPADSEQNAIVTSYISAMLHYCNRAYNRQFSIMAQSGDDLLVKLSSLINDYYENGEQFSTGVPGTQLFADKLCMSPNYFSDLLKKSTGETAGNFIRRQIVRMAKNRLAATGNVSQVAYDLGFKYPQHFSRMFKNHTGMTPSQYLASL